MLNALSEGIGKCFKSLKTRSIMRRYRGREKNELIPQTPRKLGVVCPLLLVQNWDQTPKGKPSPLGPGHPPETKNSLFAL